MGAFRLAALLVGLAVGGESRAESGPERLPEQATDILFVGDSITAGMYFFAHGDDWAGQGWAAQFMRACGIAPDRPRLEEPFPLDMLDLTRGGLGYGWRFPWNAVPALGRRPPRFDAGEARSIVAVPGQTLGEVLRQSSAQPGRASTGWVLGSFLLPEGLTAIETAEGAARDPNWIVLFLGGNDALSAFRMVGAARPPEPDDFAEDYRVIAARLRSLLRPRTPSSHLLVVTLPDVTTLPFLQEVAAGARDDEGHELPPGTKASTFLLPYRDDRFERGESWTPEELQWIRRRVAAYNENIRTIAAEEGYTVVKVDELTNELAQDPSFGTPDSPYFSPDLHHPSFRTHRRVARLVLETVSEVLGVDAPAVPPVAGAEPLPTNGDFTREERERVDVLMRLALLNAEAGHFPPRPSVRVALEVAAGLGSSRFGDVSVGGLLEIESSPGPISTRWLSRGVLGVRGVAAFSEGAEPQLPEEAQDIRAGIAVEPVGNWSWARGEAGLRYGWAGGLSWYARGEWRMLFVETGGDPYVPRRLEAGLRLGTHWGRPGHNGN